MTKLFFARAEHLPPLEELCALLPAQWLSVWSARHAAMRDPDAKRISLGALWLLLLAGGAGTLQYDANGRPSFSEGDPEFNITHTKGLLFCALVDPAVRIGIDAEDLGRVRENWRALAARWLAPGEKALFAQASTPKTFLRLWTRKEAYVKRTGEGLCALKNADTVALESSEAVTFASFLFADTVLTLCLPHGAPIPKDFFAAAWDAAFRTALVTEAELEGL